MDDAPTTQVVSKPLALPEAERTAQKGQLAVSSTEEVLITTRIEGQVEFAVQAAKEPNTAGFTGPLHSTLRKKDTNLVFSSENLADLNIPATGPTFIGYYGTADIYASSLIRDGANTFTAKKPYWELDQFKGRDFDAQPLTLAEQKELRAVKPVTFDLNQLGPGIYTTKDLVTAQEFATETAKGVSGAKGKILEVWFDGAPTVTRMKPEIKVTKGKSDAPWFANPSPDNPLVSEMEQFLQADVITSLHIKKLQTGEARVALQHKINPGSFGKVMLEPVA